MRSLEQLNASTNFIVGFFGAHDKQPQNIISNCRNEKNKQKNNMVKSLFSPKIVLLGSWSDWGNLLLYSMVLYKTLKSSMRKKGEEKESVRIPQEYNNSYAT